MKMALQLYTLREECAGDFVGTLEKVAELGFSGVEFAGYHGLLATELKGHLDRLGLSAVSTHTGLDEVIDNAKEVIEYNLAIENKKIVVPWSKMESKADAINVAEKLLKVVDLYNEKGLELLYHNHEFEFKKDEAEYLLDTFSKRADGKIQLELDLFWVFTGGENTSEFMTKNKSILSLVHIKDGIDGHPTALGEGQMDLQSTIKTIHDLGLQWMILENDNPVPDGISDIKRSMNYLKTNFKKYLD